MYRIEKRPSAAFFMPFLCLPFDVNLVWLWSLLKIYINEKATPKEVAFCKQHTINKYFSSQDCADINAHLFEGMG